MRAGRWLCSTWMLALAVAWPAHASTDRPREVSLIWVGADASSGCLGAVALAREVEDSLGRPAFSPRSNDLVVVVAMERRATSGWRALVQIRDANGATLGERELVSETDACASLNEPLVFAVTLMVDSELAKPKPPPAQEPPVRERGSRSRRELGSEGGHRSTLALDVALLGAFGTLPEPTLGGDLGLEWSALRWLGLRAHLAALVPRSRAARGDAGARFGMFEAGLQACPTTRFGDVQLAACAGLEGGLLTADSHGFAGGDDVVRPIYGWSAGLRGKVRLGGSSSLAASASALLPQHRERFVYGTGEEEERRVLFEMARVCALVGVGVGFDF